jgi:hypothetical protein
LIRQWGASPGTHGILPICRTPGLT